MLYTDKLRAQMIRKEITKLEIERAGYEDRGRGYEFAVRVTTRLIEEKKTELRPIERRVREAEIRAGDYRLRRVFA